jgi:heme exporter protein A
MLFESLSVAVRPGEALHVRGPNGSGKTTLLRILAGLTRPLEGEIRWRGQPVDADPAGFRSGLRYLGHLPGVKADLTPLEHLAATLALLGVRPRAAGSSPPSAGSTTATALDALALLGLRDFADVAVRTLSAGQRRRVALAGLALAQGELWLLDEPYNALDDAGTRLCTGLLEGHVARGGALVIASHLPVPLPAHRLRELDLEG